MLVFVINQHRERLMPCSPRKARLLLKEGKAIQQAKRDNLSQIQNIFDQIDQMGKASLTEYARNNYKQDLNQRMTLAEMRVQVRNFIDQFGVV